MKRRTSIQYQLSNVVMFNFIYYEWDEFMNVFREGKDAMKEMMINKWNKVKEELATIDNLEIWDNDKVVTKDDFDMILKKSSKGVIIFYIIFPKTNFPAASVCIAIAMTPKFPRYFTMEYSDTISDFVEMYGEEKVIEIFGMEVYKSKKDNPSFILGEFILTNNGVQHNNMGEIPKRTIGNFIERVEEIIDRETEM